MTPKTAGEIGEGLSAEERKLLLHWRSMGQVYLGGLMERGLIERRYDYSNEAAELGQTRVDGKIHDYTPLGRAVAQELQKRG